MMLDQRRVVTITVMISFLAQTHFETKEDASATKDKDDLWKTSFASVTSRAVRMIMTDHYMFYSIKIIK